MAKKLPLGVQIISVLYFIGAVASVVWAILLFVGGDYFSGAILFSGLSKVLVVAGIFCIGLGVFAFFIGRGLWKAQSWARVVVIILSALSIIGALSYIKNGVRPIIELVVSAIIGGYLAFSKEAKETFK